MRQNGFKNHNIGTGQLFSQSSPLGVNLVPLGGTLPPVQNWGQHTRHLVGRAEDLHPWGPISPLGDKAFSPDVGMKIIP
jgi:hypothetical protein